MADTEIPARGALPASQELVLRARLPIRLWAVVAGVELAGLVLLVLSLSVLGRPLLIAGLVLVALGVVGTVAAIVWAARQRQPVRLDAVGLHLGMPRPTSIGWDEVSAVKTDGVMLRIELRDGTQAVVNGRLYPRGFAELRDAIVARLHAHR